MAWTNLYRFVFILFLWQDKHLAKYELDGLNTCMGDHKVLRFIFILSYSPWHLAMKKTCEREKKTEKCFAFLARLAAFIRCWQRMFFSGS